MKKVQDKRKAVKTNTAKSIDILKDTLGYNEILGYFISFYSKKNKKKAGNFQPFFAIISQNLNHHCRHLQQEIYSILSAYLSFLYEYFPTLLEHLSSFRSELHGLL